MVAKGRPFAYGVCRGGLLPAVPAPAEFRASSVPAVRARSCVHCSRSRSISSSMTPSARTPVQKST